MNFQGVSSVKMQALEIEDEGGILELKVKRCTERS